MAECVDGKHLVVGTGIGTELRYVLAKSLQVWCYKCISTTPNPYPISVLVIGYFLLLDSPFMYLFKSLKQTMIKPELAVLTTPTLQLAAHSSAVYVSILCVSNIISMLRSSTWPDFGYIILGHLFCSHISKSSSCHQYTIWLRGRKSLPCFSTSNC